MGVRWEQRSFIAKGYALRLSLGLLVLGVLELSWELYSGAGISGHLRRWQVETYGTLNAGMWEGLTFAVLILIPIWAAAATQPEVAPAVGKPVSMWPRNVAASVPVLLLILAGTAWYISSHSPNLEAQPIVVPVDTAGANVPEAMTTLRGTAQREHAVRIVERSTLGEGATATTTIESQAYIPVTRAGWKPSEPVRFVFAATKANQMRQGRPLTGVLLRNSLPWFLRTTFERRGVRFTEPYYVVHADAYGAARGNWDAVAAIAGFLGVIGVLLMGLMLWPSS